MLNVFIVFKNHKMAFNDRISEASTLLKVYTVIMFLALVMHLIGFCTVAWTVTKTSGFTFSMGLWTSCMELVRNLEPLCAKTEIDPPSKNIRTTDISRYEQKRIEWLQIVRVLETIGLGTFVISLALASIQMFVKRNVTICYINIALILCTGVTIEAGCVYFLVKVNFEDFGYSISLSVAAGLLALTCTSIMIYETVRNTGHSIKYTQTHKHSNKGHSYMMTQTHEL